MEGSPALRESRGEEDCYPTRREDSIAGVEELDVAACPHDAMELVFDDSPFGAFLNGLRRHDGEREEGEDGDGEVALGGMAVDSGTERELDTLESLIRSERGGSHAMDGDTNIHDYTSEEPYASHEVVHFNADEVLAAAQTQEVRTGKRESSAVKEPARGTMNGGYGSLGLVFRIHAMAEHFVLRLWSEFATTSYADAYVGADGDIDNLRHRLPLGLCTLRRCLLSCNDVHESIVDKFVGSGIVIGGRASLDHRYEGNNGEEREGLGGFYSLFSSRGDGKSCSDVARFTTHLVVEIIIILLLSVWCVWLCIYLFSFVWNQFFLGSVWFENGLYITTMWFIIIFLCVAFHQYRIVRLYTATDDLVRNVESVGSGLREYNQSLSNAFAHLYELELVSRGLRVSIRHTPVERLERAGRIRATEYLKQTLRKSLASSEEELVGAIKEFSALEADVIRHTLRAQSHASKMHTFGRASGKKRTVSSEATVRARKFVNSCEKQRDCMQSAAARFQCCVNELLTLVEDAPEGPYDVSQLSQVSNLYEDALEDVKAMIVLWHQGRSTFAELIDPSSMGTTCKEVTSGETDIPLIEHYEEEPRRAPQREEFEGYTGEQSASALDDDDDDGPYRPLRPPARTAASSMPPLPPIPTNGGMPISVGGAPLPPPPPPPPHPPPLLVTGTRSLPNDAEQSGLASLLREQSKLLPTMAEELIAAGAAEGSAVEVGLDGQALLVSELKQVLRARREGDGR